MKIINIENDKITIGNDKWVKVVDRDDLNFEPKIGDEVKMYESRDNIIIVIKNDN